MSRCCGEGPIHHLMANVTRSNLTSFSITLNELTPGLQEMLPPTDS
ncbi:BnaC07g50280D [Brassica napus]|uniref:BnaC07g50280D protein n=3 Tax=Brassica TaxID=3705 RepID=A0A078JNA2_BRANA|nr:BnaC07g50280D [Brassica napus]